MIMMSLGEYDQLHCDPTSTSLQADNAGGFVPCLESPSRTSLQLPAASKQVGKQRLESVLTGFILAAMRLTTLNQLMIACTFFFFFDIVVLASTLFQMGDILKRTLNPT